MGSERDRDQRRTPPGTSPSPKTARPPRPLRPLHFAYGALALLPAFLVMCADVHFALSVPLVALSCSIGAFFILEALGSLEPAPATSAGGPTLRARATPRSSSSGAPSRSLRRSGSRWPGSFRGRS